MTNEQIHQEVLKVMKNPNWQLTIDLPKLDPVPEKVYHSRIYKKIHDYDSSWFDTIDQHGWAYLSILDFEHTYYSESRDEYVYVIEHRSSFTQEYIRRFKNRGGDIFFGVYHKQINDYVKEYSNEYLHNANIYYLQLICNIVKNGYSKKQQMNDKKEFKKKFFNKTK